MEDEINGVFNKDYKQVIYKQILSSIEAEELNNALLNMHSIWQDGAMHLCTGHRKFIDINLDSEELEFIHHRLMVVLRDYFSDLKVSSDARFYPLDTYRYQCENTDKDMKIYRGYPYSIVARLI